MLAWNPKDMPAGPGGDGQAVGKPAQMEMMDYPTPKKIGDASLGKEEEK